jgi:hypothetical protein
LKVWTPPAGCFSRIQGELVEVKSEQAFRKHFECHKPRPSGIDFTKHRIVIFVRTESPHIRVVGITRNPRTRNLELHTSDRRYCGAANPMMLRYSVTLVFKADAPPVKWVPCMTRTTCPATGGGPDTRP